MKKGQSTVEYFIFLALMIVVVMSFGMVGKLRAGFSVYFDKLTNFLR